MNEYNQIQQIWYFQFVSISAIQMKPLLSKRQANFQSVMASVKLVKHAYMILVSILHIIPKSIVSAIPMKLDSVNCIQTPLSLNLTNLKNKEITLKIRFYHVQNP